MEWIEREYFIVWSELLIDKHIDFWNWHLLAGNFSINWNEKDFWEKYENRIYYNDLATNLTFNWSTQFIQEFDLESGNGKNCQIIFQFGMKIKLKNFYHKLISYHPHIMKV